MFTKIKKRIALRLAKLSVIPLNDIIDSNEVHSVLTRDLSKDERTQYLSNVVRNLLDFKVFKGEHREYRNNLSDAIVNRLLDGNTSSISPEEYINMMKTINRQ